MPSKGEGVTRAWSAKCSAHDIDNGRFQGKQKATRARYAAKAVIDDDQRIANAEVCEFAIYLAGKALSGSFKMVLQPTELDVECQGYTSNTPRLRD